MVNPFVYLAQFRLSDESIARIRRQRPLACRRGVGGIVVGVDSEIQSASIR
jgi:hypothetical protein